MKKEKVRKEYNTLKKKRCTRAVPNGTVATSWSSFVHAHEAVGYSISHLRIQKDSQMYPWIKVDLAEVSYPKPLAVVSERQSQWKDFDKRKESCKAYEKSEQDLQIKSPNVFFVIIILVMKQH